ncbi:MAG TPA: YncE family protein [Terriglobales bacterium]|jgi:DNA-binding beta-propeller fold protein YncE
MKHRCSTVLTLVAAAVLMAGTGWAQASSGYRVLKTYKLGGEGGWDYLTYDGATHRLYISRATRVMVVDAGTGKQIGEIADTPGVHGIALAPEFSRGFVSNGREGTVSIFDLKTLKTLSKVKVGENPDAILYDPASKRVFTFNGRSHDSTAIDAEKGTVVGTIKLEGKPEFAVSDGRGEVFVNIEDKSLLDALDSNKLSEKASWPLAPCEEPSGLAMDKKNRRLFSGCDKLMAIVNADSGKVVSTLPICDGVDGTAYDEGTKLAFASCGDGNLTVIREESPDKFSVAETVPTQRGARTLTLDPETHTIYTVTAKFGERPAATAENPHPRPPVEADSFVVLVVAK